MTKRPDQHNIAPDEAGATDYKTYPNEPGDIKAHPRPTAPDTPWKENRQPDKQPDGDDNGKS